MTMPVEEIRQSCTRIGELNGVEVYTDKGVEVLSGQNPLYYTHTEDTHQIFWNTKPGEISFFSMYIAPLQTSWSIQGVAHRKIGPYKASFGYGSGELEMLDVHEGGIHTINFDNSKFILTFEEASGVLTVQVSTIGAIYLVPRAQ